MKIEYKAEEGYWLAEGRWGDRTMLAEGKTRWGAFMALMSMLRDAGI